MAPQPEPDEEMEDSIVVAVPPRINPRMAGLLPNLDTTSVSATTSASSSLSPALSQSSPETSPSLSILSLAEAKKLRSHHETELHKSWGTTNGWYPPERLTGTVAKSFKFTDNEVADIHAITNIAIDAGISLPDLYLPGGVLAQAVAEIGMPNPGASRWSPGTTARALQLMTVRHAGVKSAKVQQKQPNKSTLDSAANPRGLLAASSSLGKQTPARSPGQAPNSMATHNSHLPAQPASKSPRSVPHKNGNSNRGAGSSPSLNGTKSRGRESTPSAASTVTNSANGASSGSHEIQVPNPASPRGLNFPDATRGLGSSPKQGRISSSARNRTPSAKAQYASLKSQSASKSATTTTKTKSKVTSSANPTPMPSIKDGPGNPKTTPLSSYHSTKSVTASITRHESAIQAKAAAASKNATIGSSISNPFIVKPTRGGISVDPSALAAKARQQVKTGQRLTDDVMHYLQSRCPYGIPEDVALLDPLYFNLDQTTLQSHKQAKLPRRMAEARAIYSIVHDPRSPSHWALLRIRPDRTIKRVEVDYHDPVEDRERYEYFREEIRPWITGNWPGYSSQCTILPGPKQDDESSCGVLCILALHRLLGDQPLPTGWGKLSPRAILLQALAESDGRDIAVKSDGNEGDNSTSIGDSLAVSRVRKEASTDDQECQQRGPADMRDGKEATLINGKSARQHQTPQQSAHKPNTQEQRGVKRTRTQQDSSEDEQENDERISKKIRGVRPDFSKSDAAMTDLKRTLDAWGEPLSTHITRFLPPLDLKKHQAAAMAELEQLTKELQAAKTASERQDEEYAHALMAFNEAKQAETGFEAFFKSLKSVPDLGSDNAAKVMQASTQPVLDLAKQQLKDLYASSAAAAGVVKPACTKAQECQERVNALTREKQLREEEVGHIVKWLETESLQLAIRDFMAIGTCRGSGCEEEEATLPPRPYDRFCFLVNAMRFEYTRWCLPMESEAPDDVMFNLVLPEPRLPPSYLSRVSELLRRNLRVRVIRPYRRSHSNTISQHDPPNRICHGRRRVPRYVSSRARAHRANCQLPISKPRAMDGSHGHDPRHRSTGVL
ncbi:hypothetical protein G7046_g2326 [Stylonectria norvegica]|nr:hypothetical protein G7046_g2326 [Stylonectria norvegica]